jgi:hypothetical protein
MAMGIRGGYFFRQTRSWLLLLLSSLLLIHQQHFFHCPINEYGDAKLLPVLHPGRLKTQALFAVHHLRSISASASLLFFENSL